jgi:hypothetical protein
MNRWLSVRLESLGALATLMAAIVAVEQRGGASTAGLVLSFAMQVGWLDPMWEHGRVAVQGLPLLAHRAATASAPQSAPVCWYSRHPCSYASSSPGDY